MIWVTIEPWIEHKLRGSAVVPLVLFVVDYWCTAIATSFQCLQYLPDSSVYSSGITIASFPMTRSERHLGPASPQEGNAHLWNVPHIPSSLQTLDFLYILCSLRYCTRAMVMHLNSKLSIFIGGPSRYLSESPHQYRPGSYIAERRMEVILFDNSIKRSHDIAGEPRLSSFWSLIQYLVASSPSIMVVIFISLLLAGWVLWKAFRWIVIDSPLDNIPGPPPDPYGGTGDLVHFTVDLSSWL